MFGGFAVYFYANPEFPISLGMGEVRIILALLAVALAILSITGMLVTAQNSHWVARFVSRFIYHWISIVLVFAHSGNGRIEHSWGSLPAKARYDIELRLACCGLNAISDSPNCVANRTQSCGGTILASQTSMLNIQSTICFVFVSVELVCLLMAEYLGGQYRKLRKPMTGLKSIGGESILMQDTQTRHTMPESFRINPPPLIQTPGYSPNPKFFSTIK